MKICIIYNIPQHYRIGIWRKLSLDKDDVFHIFCDYIDNHSIKHISKSELNYYNPEGKLNIYPVLKNLYYKQVLVFQRHLFPLILSEKYNAYIFLGDYYSLSTWLSLIYLKIKKKHVIIWTHGAKGGEGIFKKIIYKLFYNLCDHLLLYGNYAKNILETDINIRKKISVIYNSLDYENQVYMRDEVKKRHPFIGQKYLVFISRIEKRKRVDILLEAFVKLIQEKKYSTMKLVIIGEGSLLKFLKKEYILENVIFLGAIFDESITANYLYNAELVVSPGHVGLNVIHSLTYGTPVITHNNFRNHAPEFEAIIPGHTGDFFKENSIVDLCSVIKKWLSKSVPRNSIRRKCYNIVDKYYNPQYQYEVIKNAIHYD